MQTLDINQLKEWKRTNKDFLFLNVLSREQFMDEHALGSRNVPLTEDGDSGDFVDRVSKLATSKDRTIVVYCAGPDCDASETAAKRLERAGYSNVYDFAGGLKAWKDADMPVSAAHAADTR